MTQEAQALAGQAMAKIDGLGKFTYSNVSRRTFIKTLNTTIVQIPLGEHNHLMVENMGADTIQMAMADEVVDWIEASPASKTLDGDEDGFLFLRSKTVAGTTVRITVWKGKS